MLMNRTRSALVTAAAALACLVPAAAAHADLVSLDACDGATLSQPFQRWGDSALYKLAPAGDFEGTLSGWSLGSGASRVAGSEPYAATGTAGASSLELKAGASAVAAATCVNAAYPTFRFFARNTSGLLSTLNVSVQYRDTLLGLVTLPVGVVAGGSAWQPTTVMLTGSAVGAAVADGATPLSLRFSAVGGTWQVDDVFVDPYARN